MTTNKRLEAVMNEQIEDILEYFNFESVQQVMSMYPNRWWQSKNGGIPTIDELKERARRLLERAAESDMPAYMTACGGFHAHKWPWSSSDRWPTTLELIFSLEDWDA
jgi:hypothetical protein